MFFKSLKVIAMVVFFSLPNIYSFVDDSKNWQKISIFNSGPFLYKTYVAHKDKDSESKRKAFSSDFRSQYKEFMFDTDSIDIENMKIEELSELPERVSEEYGSKDSKIVYVLISMQFIGLMIFYNLVFRGAVWAFFLVPKLVAKASP